MTIGYQCAYCGTRDDKNHRAVCPKDALQWWQDRLPTVDLRSICRHSDRCVTTVYVAVDRYRPHEHKWLVLGEGHLDRHMPDRDEHTLRAYLGYGATDFEHDSAYAAQLVVQGVRWHNVSYHCTSFSAFIPPDIEPEHFRVPQPGYDPFALDKTVECPRCKTHPMVPENYYVPPGDENAFKLLRGRRIRIVFSTERACDG